MKTSEQRIRETRRQHTETIVARHLSALFDRQPMLCGFAVRYDLEVEEVSVCWPGYTAGPDLYAHLMQTLADLAEERPEAIELVRGRTFARAIQ
jgi:hypothetical protein